MHLAPPLTSSWQLRTQEMTYFPTASFPMVRKMIIKGNLGDKNKLYLVLREVDSLHQGTPEGRRLLRGESKHEEGGAEAGAGLASGAGWPDVPCSWSSRHRSYLSSICRHGTTGRDSSILGLEIYFNIDRCAYYLSIYKLIQCLLHI